MTSSNPYAVLENRYAALGEAQLASLSKLRSLPVRESEEGMIAALLEQDEADRAQDAEWLAEKDAQDAAAPANPVSATPATPFRTTSWADDAQDEADAMAKVEAGVEVKPESESGWKTIPKVKKRSARTETVNEKAAVSQGTAVEREEGAPSIVPNAFVEEDAVAKTKDDAGSPEVITASMEEEETAAALPMAAALDPTGDVSKAPKVSQGTVPIEDEIISPSPVKKVKEQTKPSPDFVNLSENTATPPAAITKMAGDSTGSPNDQSGAPQAGTVLQEELLGTDETTMIADAPNGNDDSASVASAPSDKPEAPKRAVFPAWDDYIGSMPLISALARPTPETMSPASSSAIAPSYAAAASTTVSKVTTGSEVDSDNTTEQVEAAGMPTTPSKGKKKRGKKGGKKVKQKKAGTASNTSSPDDVSDASASTTAIAEDLQTDTTKTAEATQTAASSFKPVVDLKFNAAPIVEELRAATLKSEQTRDSVSSSIQGATKSTDSSKETTAPTDTNPIESSDIAFATDNAVEDVHKDVPAPSKNVEGVHDSAIYVASMVSIIEEPTVIVDEVSKPLANSTSEALNNSNVDDHHATTPSEDEDGLEKEFILLQPVRAHKKKNKKRTKAQRRAAKEAAVAVFKTSSTTHDDAHEAPDELDEDNKPTIASVDEAPSTGTSNAVPPPPVGMSAAAPLKQKKPSGAQRRKAKQAELAGLQKKTVGFQVGSFFLPWYAALAIFMAQLIVTVVGIYLAM